MRKISSILFTLLVGLQAGCRASGPEVKVGAGADLGRYRRVGVLPFREQGGDGRRPTDAVEQTLRRQGIDTVDSAQMRPVFDSLHLGPDDEISLEQLLAVRTATQAEALVFGSVAPKRKGGRPRLLVLVIDGQSGDLVARGELDVPPQDKGGIETAAERVFEEIRAELERRRREPSEQRLEEL